MSLKEMGSLLPCFLVLALLFVSSMALSVAVEENDNVFLLVEADESIKEYLKADRGEVKVDYENGRYLIEISERDRAKYDNLFETIGDEERYQIHLDNWDMTFDRRDGMPKVPDRFHVNEENVKRSYIVQFIGPIKSGAWKDELRENGAFIERDMRNYAVLTRMDKVTKERIKDLETVAWVGRYKPAYKIRSELLDSDGIVDVQVVGWRDTNIRILMNKLDDVGATIGRYNGVGVICTIDTELLPYIATFSEVKWVDLHSPTRTFDNQANEITEVQEGWYSSWSGLPSRLTGAGQVIGIQDSGFSQGDQDMGHPDFFDGPLGDRVIRYEDRTGNSDPDGYGDGIAHGTHVAGVALGNGWCWRNSLGFDANLNTNYHYGEATGVAPEAYLSMDGVAGSNGGLTPSHSYWDNQESDDARVFSNSWGSAPADYDSNAANIDDRLDPYSGSSMTHAEEDIIVFAVGKDGPEQDTISPRSQSKNGLGIGGSENYRNEWHSAENPTKVADFSGRGGTFSEGRIKPDILAPATAAIGPLGAGEWEFLENNGGSVPQPNYIQEIDEYDYTIPGPGSDGIADYKYMGGTSTAAPQVAGGLLLIRQYYKDVEGILTPSNPLVKATLINGADRMSETLYEYPGYDQGWGRMNLKNSLYPDASSSIQFDEHTFTGTGTWDPSFDLNINSGDVPLKATLVWTDASGVDLYRQLDFEMTSPSGDTYHSGVNNYDSNGWTQPNTNNGDTVNNVHRVEVENPESGVWSMTVNGNSIPSNADCAIVISADFGPQETYDVDLQTDHPTTLKLVPGGSTHLPIKLRNWGTTSDTIVLTDNTPASLTTEYDPSSSSLALASEEEQAVDITLSADVGIIPDVYEFTITGTSQGDTSAQDNLRYNVQVLTEKIPYKGVIADSTVDESYADVLTFTDSGGTDYIFLAYRMDTTDGQQVHVKYSTLGTDGRPTGWSTPINVQAPSATPTETPPWIKLLHISGGTYEDRVMCYWNGGIPGTDPYRSEAKVTWTDPGSYGSWATPVQIDDNYGTDDTNTKRASYMLWRDNGTADGELMYVFEHLDSSEAGGTSGIGIAYTTTSDGGSSWANLSDVPGAAPGGDYHYFFPDGVTDQNNVNWHFFYYRESTGDSRMVVVKIQDNNGWSDEISVIGDLSGGDNHQYPRAAHQNRSGTNTVYCSALYDDGGVEWDLSTAYVQGDYTSSSSPSFTSQDHVAGTEISRSGYIESNVLATTTTEVDDHVWTGYQESGTSSFDYGRVNIHGLRSDDLYSTSTKEEITNDNNFKLNPQMDSLTIDGTSYVYTTYHMNEGDCRDVNFNIYLSIMHDSWEAVSDIQGPETYLVSTIGNYTEQSTFNLSATIDDTETGFSEIQDAQWIDTSTSVTDPTTIDWSGAASMALSGNTQIEVANDTISFSGFTTGWHRIWVRGQDEYNNWGTEYADHVDIYVYNPSVDVYSLGVLTAGGESNGWNFISYNKTRVDTVLTSILDDGTYGIPGNYDKVMWFDANNQEWRSYISGRDSRYNDLSSWDITMGLWIQMTSDDELEIEYDSPPTTTDITLYPGWNMVGYPSSTNRIASDILPSEVTKMGIFNKYAPYNIEYVAKLDFDTEAMVSGRAYWLYNGADYNVIWTVEY